MVLVGVLGTLELRSPDGRAVRLASPRQRRLLIALALHANAPVDADVLADLVWGEDLPTDPAGALQTNVARLRRQLPAGAAIVTEARAYRLAIDGAAIDAGRFAVHLRSAGTAADPGDRLRELEAALGLWRGRPYLELDHPSVTPEVVRLGELKASAAEARAEALLAAGRADEAVAALEALTNEESLRERPVGILMRALVAVGRQGDALRAYRRLREALVDQLGIDPSPELRRLEEQVLRQEVAVPPPPEGSGPRRRSRPPVPVSSFVGREEDMARVIEQLDRCRIVTLCGPGGVGKSRLARHVADAVVDRYDDGVLVVDLSGLHNPDHLPGTVAAALRLSAQAGESLADRLVEVLGLRRQLLLLDNCEHLAEAVAGLCESVAMGTGGVDFLVTSREGLRADGEQVVTVAPLPAAAAATLLAQRIQASDPASASTAADLALVEGIAERLDCLPLALELAAGRVPGMGLRALHDALDEPFEVLHRGRRTAADRHRSLLDVVEWSYGLLSEVERDLFVRLATFVGPVEADAVVAVCGGDGSGPSAVRVALADLVDRSLVTLRPGEPASYGMLDTLRAFGRRRLSTSPEREALQARHARWVVSFAEERLAEALTSGEPEAVRRFDAHLADLRQAQAHLSGTKRLDELLRLSFVLAHHGYRRLRIDLVRLVDHALDLVGDASHPLVARLLGTAANFDWQRGDHAAAERRCERAFALARSIGDPALAREAHEALGNVALLRGELPRARAECERALDLSRSAGDRFTELMALCDLVLSTAYAGEDEAGAGFEAELTALATGIGSPSFLGWAAYASGERRAESDPEAAVSSLTRAVTWAEAADERFLAGLARHTLLTTAARSGDPAAGLPRFGPLIDHWHTTGAWAQLWIAIRALIETLARHERHRDVAVLLAAHATSRRAAPLFGPDAQRLEAAARSARAALGADFDTAYAEGVSLGDDGALLVARRLTR